MLKKKLIIMKNERGITLSNMILIMLFIILGSLAFISVFIAPSIVKNNPQTSNINNIPKIEFDFTVMDEHLYMKIKHSSCVVALVHYPECKCFKNKNVEKEL